MNIHAALLPPITEVEDDDEEEDEDLPACERCGSHEFEQHYSGSFSNYRSVSYSTQWGVATDVGDDDLDETDADEWRCENRHPVHDRDLERRLEDDFQSYN